MTLAALGLDGPVLEVSFGQPVTQLDDLIEAVSQFVSRAAEKLRKQESRAGPVLCFIRTSPFRRDDKQYSRSVTIPLRRPTANTAALLQAAVHGAKAIFKPGFNYAKAGGMLLDLQDASVEQQKLKLDEAPPDRSALMETIDRLNERYGPGSIALASTGKSNGQRTWTMK